MWNLEKKLNEKVQMKKKKLFRPEEKKGMKKNEFQLSKFLNCQMVIKIRLFYGGNAVGVEKKRNDSQKRKSVPREKSDGDKKTT